MSIKAQKGNGIQYKKSFDVMEYKETQTWLKTVSENSRNNYIFVIKKFCAFSGKNPTELILERDKELRNPDPNSRTGIRDLILDFRKYLEKEEYAPKTIGAMDGIIRGLFTANLGRPGMINVRNYENRCVSTKKDFVPTLEELKNMLDVSSLEEQFRIIFLAQTGMRISDALALTFGDIERELNLGKVPMAIVYLPKKDRVAIGERVTFLGNDGVEILKRYLEWRKSKGEEITSETPLFVGRNINKKNKPLTQQNLNLTLKNAYKKAGFNGNGKYGTIRAHSFKKFFTTQLTNHGVEDKIISFLTCHKISEVDRVYWSVRVDQLRKIYAERQNCLNPLNSEKEYDLSKIQDIKEKIEALEKRIKELEEKKENPNGNDVKIVSTEKEIIKFAGLGYDCQIIGANKWLMKK